MLSIHEIKTAACAAECIYQIAQSVRLIFRHQPTRRFVLASFLIGVDITLVVFDRSGTIKSTAFNIHEEPMAFVRIIVGIMCADLTTLGFDPSVSLSNGKGHLLVDSTKYIIDDLLYAEGVIRGRGTVCYKVHRPGRENVHYVVKDSWVDTSRLEKEEQILRRLAGVKGVAKLVQHAPVRINNILDSTARFRIPLISKKTITSAISSKQIWKWKKPVFNKVEIREHHRIVIAPYAQKLEDFPSLIGFTTIIRDISQGMCAFKFIGIHQTNTSHISVIKDIYEAGYLHRDINLRNILFEEKGDSVQGILIDFEFAVKVERSSAVAVGHRTVSSRH